MSRLFNPKRARRSVRRDPAGFGPAMFLLALALAVLAAAGCGGTQNHTEESGAKAAERTVAYHPVQADASQTQIDDRITPKGEIDQMVAPFRQQMDAQMNEVLAWCPDNMRTRKPEGNLGNLVADFVLARAQRDAGVPVAACVLNNGGLRVPWSEGPITLGLVYEVMPFDNDVVVLRLTADQMRSLADEIAARGGEPVAGMEFTIQHEKAAGLLVGGAPVAEHDYWVATNNYLADGGGGMPTLWTPQERISMGLLVRDVIADAVRAIGAEGGSPDGSRPGALPRPAMGRIKEG